VQTLVFLFRNFLELQKNKYLKTVRALPETERKELHGL